MDKHPGAKFICVKQKNMRLSRNCGLTGTTNGYYMTAADFGRVCLRRLSTLLGFVCDSSETCKNVKGARVKDFCEKLIKYLAKNTGGHLRLPTYWQ